MARKKAGDGINKSEEIRKQLQETPDAGPQEIASRLRERGIEVSESLVSVVKTKSGPNGRKTVRKAPRKAATGGASKSQQVKDYLAEHPEAGPNEIAAALGERGVRVSVSLANKVKSGMRRGGRRRKKAARRLPAAQPMAARTTSSQAHRTVTGRLSADDLFEAKRLVDQLGGIAQAKQALEALEQLR